MTVITHSDKVQRRLRNSAQGAPESGSRHPPYDLERLKLRQFLVMERAFTAHGGLVSGEEITMRLRTRHDQPISLLARWIVSRKIVCLTWRAQTFVPMFQFDQSDMTLRTSVTQVVEELRDVFDDWELAGWFVEPNTWLKNEPPLRLIEVNFSTVLDAARADRFVARGF